jgi:hypothetical protein
MMIELKQDKAIETYVTKARQYIDNFHIYLFIIKERQRKKESSCCYLFANKCNQ